MGITNNFAKFLAAEKVNGSSFKRVLTIGRLNNFITLGVYKHLCRFLNISGNKSDDYINLFKSFSSAYKSNKYSENFFYEILNSKEVKSVDISSYEGADFIFDLNNNIDQKQLSLMGEFDAIIDGGSIEHIFDIKTLISNYSKLLKKGGNLYISTMANNHFGHGFYQFSSEFFFRTLNLKNGFQLKKVLLDIHKFPGPELSFGSNIYECINPSKLNRRTLLFNKFSMLIVAAKKINIMKPNQYNKLKPVVQFDYQENNKIEKKNRNIVEKIVLNHFPALLVNYLVGYYQLFCFYRIKKNFIKIKNILNIYEK